jgi:hypothetical protein
MTYIIFAYEIYCDMTPKAGMVELEQASIAE